MNSNGTSDLNSITTKSRKLNSKNDFLSSHLGSSSINQLIILSSDLNVRIKCFLPLIVMWPP